MKPMSSNSCFWSSRPKLKGLLWCKRSWNQQIFGIFPSCGRNELGCCVCVVAVQRPATGVFRKAPSRPPTAQRRAEKGKSCCGPVSCLSARRWMNGKLFVCLTSHSNRFVPIKKNILWAHLYAVLLYLVNSLLFCHQCSMLWETIHVWMMHIVINSLSLVIKCQNSASKVRFLIYFICFCSRWCLSFI